MNRNKLAIKIEKAQELIEDPIRNYIGASIIGSDCLRQIWYEYKGTVAEKVPPKTRRTWMIGKVLEGLVLDWLQSTGIEIVRNYKPLAANDQEYFKGHLDSVWMKNGIPFAIIEVKTAKDASFKVFVKKGAQVWNPQYYAQVQAYMGMSGIYSTYILVLNKDNSDISDELVTFDPVFYESLKGKAKVIYEASSIPPKINGSPLWYQCKMCKFNKVCHK